MTTIYFSSGIFIYSVWILFKILKIYAPAAQFFIIDSIYFQILLFFSDVSVLISSHVHHVIYTLKALYKF